MSAPPDARPDCGKLVPRRFDGDRSWEDMHQEFTEEQKQYLQGFAAGSGLQNRGISLAVVPAAPTSAQDAGGAVNANGARGMGANAASRSAGESASGADALLRAAQDRIISAGGKLVLEEQVKRNKNGLDLWDEMLTHARANRFPKGTDVFLFKFQGLFYVAPAQDSFMCRLRLPAGIINSHQMRGAADLAEQYAGGTADVTTRANLQIRQIGAKHTTYLLAGLFDLGIIPRGSGADNIRNITASPTAGFDPRELIDTRALARQMHHYILNHREMYGLPRKFNIAFDGGGGSISALEDTNDIGFVAVRVNAGVRAGSDDLAPGVYFRMQLGGITGHKDFARDTGVLLTAEECIPAAAAIVRVFIDHGDRTDRKKARLKYLLDQWGLEKFLAEVERKLPPKLRRFPLGQCNPRPSIAKHGHVGVHVQKQPDLNYIGIVAPVGRLTVDQMHGLARIAERYGSATIRLTVWQNLLISD